MGNLGYILMVSVGIVLCGMLSVYVILGFMREESVKIEVKPSAEVVAAITATLSAMLGEPTYNFIIKDINRKGEVNG